MTLVCVIITVAGTPVGAQVAWLDMTKTGMPLAKTLVAPDVNCAVKQGPLDAFGGGFGQAATTYCVGTVVTG
ncbi:secreted protein [Rhodopirellula maiorica SM1]|uniref:Secreted protein n=1 Tax=Rhodopirellula maiorica SM1 TaxID=1265738 RepID=M5S729_9BACT|nr:secreted protein [Rhodopirellula maiorica SM1]